MTTRQGYWLSGLAVGISLVLLFYSIETEAEWASDRLAWAFFGGLLSMAFLGEIVAGIKESRSYRKKTGILQDTSAADGIVEVTIIPAVTAKANTRDPRFREFIALESQATPARIRARANGKVQPLLGRVTFASLFLGREGKGWLDDEIARTQAALIRTGLWIENEAKRWGAAINVEVADVYFKAIDPRTDEPIALAMVSEEFQEELMDSDAEVRLVTSASRAAAKLGFHDIGDLARQVANRLQTDSVVWFLHPRSAGRSFVVSEQETGMRGVSLAICYAREDDLPGPLVGSAFADPSTFAHEALHLFGASDKYGIPLSQFPEASVTERDIMRLGEDRLPRLRIDPATASEIGWR